MSAPIPPPRRKTKPIKGKSDDQTDPVEQTKEQPLKQTEDQSRFETEEQPKNQNEKQVGKHSKLSAGITGDQPEVHTEGQYETLAGQEQPRDETGGPVEENHEKKKKKNLIESSLLENKEDQEEITKDRKTMLQKVLDGVNKTKDDVKKVILEKIEKGEHSKQLDKETDEHVTTVEKLRLAMNGGSKRVKKVLGDVKAMKAFVSKNDKQNEGENGELVNITSTESSLLESSENPKEEKNVVLAEHESSCITNDELTEEIKNEVLAKDPLIGNEEQSEEVDSSLFTYCENSGEIKNVFLTESSLHENEDQSLESLLLGYCEKSGEIKNITNLENGEQGEEKSVEAENVSLRAVKDMPESDQHTVEIATSVQSGNFQKVLEAVDKILEVPTEEDMEEFSEKSVCSGFQLKIYGILICQLSIIICIISIFIFFISKEMESHSWLLWISILISLALALTLVFNISLRLHCPTNIIFFALFTIFESIMFGMITILYEVKTFLIIFIFTAGVILILAIFTFQKKVNYTSCSVIVVSLIFILIMFIISVIVTPLNWFLPLFFGAIGSFLLTLWIIYDIQVMVQGTHIFIISPDQYIFATLALQLFIFHMLLAICKFIRGCCDKMCKGKLLHILGGKYDTMREKYAKDKNASGDPELVDVQSP